MNKAMSNITVQNFLYSKTATTKYSHSLHHSISFQELFAHSCRKIHQDNNEYNRLFQSPVLLVFTFFLVKYTHLSWLLCTVMETLGIGYFQSSFYALQSSTWHCKVPSFYLWQWMQYSVQSMFIENKQGYPAQPRLSWGNV